MVRVGTFGGQLRFAGGTQQVRHSLQQQRREVDRVREKVKKAVRPALYSRHLRWYAYDKIFGLCQRQVYSALGTDDYNAL